jgi:hypothetical protein
MWAERQLVLGHALEELPRLPHLVVELDQEVFRHHP